MVQIQRLRSSLSNEPRYGNNRREYSTFRILVDPDHLTVFILHGHKEHTVSHV